MKPQSSQDPQSPIFPYWYQVIDALYETDLFKECNLDKDSKTHYKSQTKLFKETFVFPLVEPEKMVQNFDKRSKGKIGMSDTSEKEMFKKYSALNARGNQFTLIGDAHQMTFIEMSSNLKDVLNLPSNDEFDLFKLCGMDEKYELFHPQDVYHIIRLGEAIIQTAGVRGIEWIAFEDTYQIEFRMGYNDPSRFITITRQCQLSDPTAGSSGRRHIDIWKVLKGHDQFSHVKVTLIGGKNSAMMEVARNLFFATNCMLLDLTPRDVILAHLLSNHSIKHFFEKVNAKCSELLGENTGYSRQACSDMKSKLMAKINNRIEKNTMGEAYKKEAKQWNFFRKCGQLGILNVPSQLEKSIWKAATY